MVRPVLTPEERERGRRLGGFLRSARGSRSLADVAALSGVPVETIRKIESGRIPTPAFFTVVAMAGALDLTVDEVVAHCHRRRRRRTALTA